MLVILASHVAHAACVVPRHQNWVAYSCTVKARSQGGEGGIQVSSRSRSSGHCDWSAWCLHCKYLLSDSCGKPRAIAIPCNDIFLVVVLFVAAFLCLFGTYSYCLLLAGRLLCRLGWPWTNRRLSTLLLECYHYRHVPLQSAWRCFHLSFILQDYSKLAVFQSYFEGCNYVIMIHILMLWCSMCYLEKYKHTLHFKHLLNQQL